MRLVQRMKSPTSRWGQTLWPGEFVGELHFAWTCLYPPIEPCRCIAHIGWPRQLGSQFWSVPGFKITLLGCSDQQQIFPGFCAGEDQALGGQLVQSGLVGREFGTLDQGRAVPIEPQPLQDAKDVILPRGGG